MPTPQYEDVYDPPMLDSTGQAILQAIQALSAPSATNVAISPTGMHIVTEDDVQGAISELDTAVDSVNSSLANKVGNESNSEMKMKIGTINTSSSITFTAQIAFLITFGTNGEQGIFGCRSGVIQDIITAGSAITHSVSGTTYTFNNTSASVGARYLLAYI